MQIEDFLREVTALPGLTGNESPVAEYIAEAFRPLANEVTVDVMQNVTARMKGTGPKVMLAAHADEIGLMVTAIEKDGSLRLNSVGGVDPRILPGMVVKVYGTETLTGVIGAKAPHLMTQEEREKNYRRENLHVDLGLPHDEVIKKVRMGDLVQLEARFVKLQNGQIATKTADDRACVAIMLRAMQLLQNMKHQADLYFVATSQEEIGSHGAKTSAYALDPDIGVALDVCHAVTPDAPKTRTHSLDAPVASMGPFINPYLRGRLMEVAKKQNINVQTAVVPGGTSTDADRIGVALCGVPTVLIELPLKYMHTTVETFDMHTLEECARLLANFAAAVSPSWMEEIWT